ncbi:MAG: hypothetical protein NVS9B13_12890 [Candidatus Acidiferrum sp.]
MRSRTGVTNEKFHKPHELGNEENKGKDGESEESVAKDFAKDVPVQDAHGANAECNTVHPTNPVSGGDTSFRIRAPFEQKMIAGVTYGARLCYSSRDTWR